VRNHGGRADWTLDALESYTRTRMFVLLSRVPPVAGEPGAPTDDELAMLADDLFTIAESGMLAKWKRARTTAQNQRAFRAAERGGEDEDEEDDDEEEEDEDDLYARDPEAAETAWRARTKVELRTEAVSRWAASRVAVDAELATLRAQLRALERMREAAVEAAPIELDIDGVAAYVDRVVEAGNESTPVLAILQRWRDRFDTGGWTSSFAAPRLKCPQITSFLSENRSERTRAWLRLQREAHSAASQAERATGVMGDAYGSSWPFADVPSAVNAPGDHCVPVEAFAPNANLILEHSTPAQNVSNIVISTLESNSAKGSKSLGLFLPPSEQRASAAYAPQLVSQAKIAMLARTTAFVFCSYVGASSMSRSFKGAASLARSSGDAVYARSLEQNDFARWLRMPVSTWERRIALLTLGMPEYQVCNPFVLYPNIVSDALLKLLSQRFRGTDDPILSLCDEALRDSVLRAPG
jgi:hypothetical protein